MRVIVLTVVSGRLTRKRVLKLGKQVGGALVSLPTAPATRYRHTPGSARRAGEYGTRAPRSASAASPTSLGPRASSPTSYYRSPTRHARRSTTTTCGRTRAQLRPSRLNGACSRSYCSSSTVNPSYGPDDHDFHADWFTPVMPASRAPVHVLVLEDTWTTVSGPSPWRTR